MLDGDEFAVVSDLYSNCMKAAKESRRNLGLSLKDCSLDEHFLPVREAYERMTGAKDIQHHNAIMHHRISIYGSPCKSCGKPLRTPRASFCAACGQVSIESVKPPA